MKLIRTIGKPIHRPIRAAFAILAVAAVPAGAVVVPALAGASTTAATAAAATKCPTGWGSLPEASKYRGSGLLTNDMLLLLALAHMLVDDKDATLRCQPGNQGTEEGLPACRRDVRQPERHEDGVEARQGGRLPGEDVGDLEPHARIGQPSAGDRQRLFRGIQRGK